MRKNYFELPIEKQSTLSAVSEESQAEKRI